MTHDEKKDWEFFRKTAREVFWPHIEQEYRDELTGIVEGLAAHGVKLDIWDMVALNAWLELPYYDRVVSGPRVSGKVPRGTIAARSWPPAATRKTVGW